MAQVRRRPVPHTGPHAGLSLPCRELSGKTGQGDFHDTFGFGSDPEPVINAKAAYPQGYFIAEQYGYPGPYGGRDLLINEKVLDFFMSGHPQRNETISGLKIPESQWEMDFFSIEEGLFARSPKRFDL